MRSAREISPAGEAWSIRDMVGQDTSPRLIDGEMRSAREISPVGEAWPIRDMVGQDTSPRLIDGEMLLRSVKCAPRVKFRPRAK